jgi:3-oxoacyl-[acyl-carrier protein] reductase
LIDHRFVSRLQLAAISPLERLGESADIAGTVAFLCSKDGGGVNGQALRANGGFT